MYKKLSELLQFSYACNKELFNINIRKFQLISDAIRYGDCHKTTMEMADYWLVEKQLVHKLFKVLVPRYQNYNVSFTRMIKVPKPYPGKHYEKAVLELRGNPYPSLLPDRQQNRNLIHNVLLDEAKKAYRTEKYAQIIAKIDEAEKSSLSSPTVCKKAETDTSTNAEESLGEENKAL